MEIAVDNFTPDLKIHCVFTSSTQTWCYIVAERSSGHAAIIDPTISKGSRTIETSCPDTILSIIRTQDYTIDHILETSSFERHLSAGWYLRTQLLETRGLAPRIAVQQSLKIVQRIYARKYGIRNKFWAGEFDGNFLDGQILRMGNLSIRVIHLPGRSKYHVGYLIQNHLFTGDCCFHIPDDGDLSVMTKNCLEASIERVRNLPRDLRVSMSRGCPARHKGPGCVAEIWERHADDNEMPRNAVGEGLDEGLIS